LVHEAFSLHTHLTRKQLFWIYALTTGTPANQRGLWWWDTTKPSQSAILLGSLQDIGRDGGVTTNPLNAVFWNGAFWYAY
jgi:hypothetical protein